MNPSTNTLRRSYAPRLQAIAEVVPDAYAALVDAWAASAAAVNGTLLATIQDRVQEVLNAADGSTPVAADTPEVRFIDQFVSGVADVDERLTAPLATKYGKAGMRNFVEAVYIIDQSVRLCLTHERLLAPGPNTAGNAVSEPDRVLTPARANIKWHDAILAQTGLDALTREVIRLRAGWYHDCRLCNSCRLVDKDHRVIADADMETRILSYQEGSMSAPHTAALRYTDAHMVNPAGSAQALTDELRRYFSEPEILQLTIEVSSWSYQKVLVALAIDEPVSTDGLTAITIGADGALQLGKLIAPSYS